MVTPNKPKTLRNLESALSRIILDGLVWEKKVSKGSGCGLICVPETLIGKRLKVILIPVDENDSLSTQKKIAINNETIRNNNSQRTKAENRNKKLEEQMAQENQSISETPAPSSNETIPALSPTSNEGLEDEDAY